MVSNCSFHFFKFQKKTGSEIILLPITIQHIFYFSNNPKEMWSHIGFYREETEAHKGLVPMSRAPMAGKWRPDLKHSLLCSGTVLGLFC